MTRLNGILNCVLLIKKLMYYRFYLAGHIFFHMSCHIKYFLSFVMLILFAKVENSVCNVGVINSNMILIK